VRPNRNLLTALVLTFSLSTMAQTAPPGPSLLDILAAELEYAKKNLVSADGTRPYFISYAITDERRIEAAASLGALTADDDRRTRRLDVEVRVGDHDFDSSRKLPGDARGSRTGAGTICLDDHPTALRQALWLATDAKFKAATRRFDRLQTSAKTSGETDEVPADFSREAPVQHTEPLPVLKLNRDAWLDRLRRVSQITRDEPLIRDSSVTLTARADGRTFVNSEGTRIQQGNTYLRVILSVRAQADDGMDLSKSHIFDAATEEKLPSESQMADALRGIIREVLALREAPLIEPCVGPAILMNRASGVFFHEIFGHRIEGHRLKDDDDGQTFAGRVGEPVLPDFISVRDDPSMPAFGGQDLRGHYRFDDEGVSGANVLLVDRGILKTFLMSRSPLANVAKSNGHGRRQAGSSPVSRQGNLLVESAKAVPFSKLRELLLEECKKQGKPFGLVFEDITGGRTETQRQSSQSFKVLPVVVYRVYVDGRPDELVRGVDIVGTPLTCFSKIIAVGDDPAVFNGDCGAESGFVPVSAISPSILVSQIEVQKRPTRPKRPPLLPSPVELQVKKDKATDQSTSRPTESPAQGAGAGPGA